MSVATRDSRLLQTFAGLADTLVADYDVLDLLQGLVESVQQLLDATAVGILLASDEGDLEVVASTSEGSHLLELMQLGPGGGPCVECYLTGVPVSVSDIGGLEEQWPRFRDVALGEGLHSVHAVPLRLRERTIGSLNLFRDVPGDLDDWDNVAARALADVATIGILQERAFRESDSIREQLQRALNSRVVIEQAKGVIAFTHNVSMQEAFEKIRRYARNNSLELRSVAERIVARTLRLE